MWPKASLLLAYLLCLSSSPAAPPAPALPPPTTYLDEAGTRFLTLDWHEGGKVKVALRTVGGPGQYGRWAGDGEQTDKGVVFSQTVEEGDRGAAYLATGGQGRLVVKLKPGQAGVGDAGLVGVYRRITDDKIASLLKKDAELAEKKVDETLKLTAHRLPVEDRPALLEWKKRWPALRSRLTASAGLPPPINSATGPAPADPKATSPPKDPTAYWMALAETSGAAVTFLSQPLEPTVKPGWEGLYDDGFGGSADLQLLKSGRIKFVLTASRIAGSVNGTLDESLPPEMVKNNPAGTEGTAEFTDHNEEVKDPTQQTRIRFHRIGHFLIIESEYAERYANKAWFDGIYFKHPTPPAE